MECEKFIQKNCICLCTNTKTSYIMPILCGWHSSVAGKFEQCGRVAEWLNVPPWKGGVSNRAPRVRIPPLPPSYLLRYIAENSLICKGFEVDTLQSLLFYGFSSASNSAKFRSSSPNDTDSYAKKHWFPLGFFFGGGGFCSSPIVIRPNFMTNWGNFFGVTNDIGNPLN